MATKPKTRKPKIKSTLARPRSDVDEESSNPGQEMVSYSPEPRADSDMDLSMISYPHLPESMDLDNHESVLEQHRKAPVKQNVPLPLLTADILPRSTAYNDSQPSASSARAVETNWDITNTPTIEELKAATGVNDAQLKMEFQQDDAVALAPHFDDPKKLLCRLPGLSKAKSANILNVAKNDIEEAVIDALKAWRELNPIKATYRALVEIALDMHNGDLARTVCRHVTRKLKIQAISDSSTVPSGNTGTLTLHTLDNSSISHPVQAQATQAHGMETLCINTSTIKEKIESFEHRFVVLRVSACSELASKDVSLQTLRITLMTLPVWASHQHRKFIDENYDIFKDAKTVEDIFKPLNFYWSFLNYNLLAHVIKYFGSQYLKQEMNSYCEDMKRFQKETMIADIIPYLPQTSNHPEGYSNLNLKVDYDITTTSLEDLEDYRKQFAKEFLLPDFALLLADLKQGSMLIVWLVPSTIISTLKKEIEMRRKEPYFFSKFQILQINVEEDIQIVRLPDLELDAMAAGEPDPDLDALAVQVEGLDLEENEAGHGAYGVVYRVTVDGKECFAKKLHSILVQAYSYYPDATTRQKDIIVEKFRKECLILSELNHPNVVSFVGVHFGRDRNDISLVIEMLRYELADFVEKNPNILLIKHIRILYDVSKGLHFLHSLTPPLIHRDLTAYNILLTEDLTAKIADLGVSRYLDPSMANTARLTVNPGHIAYMPPESQMKDPVYTTKLDIFSFGNLILHIINGKLPRVYTLPLDRMNQLSPEGRVELMRRNDSVHERMNEQHCLYPLIIRCLHDRPEGRPSAEEVSTTLRELYRRTCREMCLDACKKGQVEIVIELISEGADVNQLDEDGGCPIYTASFHGHHQVVEQLIRAGANVNVQKEGGWTALHAAAEKGHLRVVEMLLEANADVNIKTNGGWTALCAAAEKGHLRVVEMLLEANADVNIKTSSGECPIYTASFCGHHQVVEQLIRAGANVNVQKEGGATALGAAAQEGHLRVVEMLLEAIADVNIKNDTDRFPRRLR